MKYLISSKFWLLIFLFIAFSLGPALSFSDAKENSKSKCGIRCHKNKKNIYSKMKLDKECTQCHNSGNVPISMVAMGNKNHETIAPIDHHEIQQKMNFTSPLIFPYRGGLKGVVKNLIKKARHHTLIAQITCNKKEYKDMAMIPAGPFIMGSNERWHDESPEFINRTGAYLIDIYEVTNSKYKEFVDANNYSPPVFWFGGKIPEGLKEHPVTYVNWYDASAFCHWMGKRLPIESEWEKAARGVFGNTFPWGDEFDPSITNSPESRNNGTKPVGSYESGKSPYGLYDMAGNVWEWTSDWYKPHPGNYIPDDKYGKVNRMIKGGSWFDCMAYGCGISAPSYNRGAVVPATKNNTIGIRCVTNLKN